MSCSAAVHCATSLHSKLSSFRVEKKYCDVTIIVEGKSFKCHRVILAAVCDYFDSMFGGQFRESYVSEITMVDINAEAFESILEYAYTGHFPLIHGKDGKAYDLLRTSEFLGASKVLNHCIEHFRSRGGKIEHLAEVYAFACAVNKITLKKSLKNYIVENFWSLWETDELLNIAFDEFNELLKAYNLPSLSYRSARFLHIRDEGLLLDVMIRWICHLPKDRSQYFKEMCKLVNFERIPQEYIKFLSREYGIECTDPLLLRNQLEGVVNDANVDSCDEKTLPRAYGSIFSSKDQIMPYVFVRYTGENSNSVKMFSFDKKKPDKWSLVMSSEKQFPFTAARSVVFDKADSHLYSYGYNEFEKKSSFSKFANLNRPLNGRALTLPPCSCAKFDMCGIKDDQICWLNTCPDTQIINYGNSSEYGLSDEEMRRNIYSYNCELDKWFAMPEVIGRDWYNACITADDSLIHLIGTDSWLNGSRAYDFRTSAWQKIPKTNNYFPDPICCTSNGKIYVSDVELIETYDSVAGKWLTLSSKVQSRCAPGPAKKVKLNYPGENRMIPFGNMLWIFAETRSRYDKSNYFTYVVDPYAEPGKNWCTFNSILQSSILAEKNCCFQLPSVFQCNCLETSSTHRKNSKSAEIVDAVAFHR